jgi:hypothetical protein
VLSGSAARAVCNNDTSQSGFHPMTKMRFTWLPVSLAVAAAVIAGAEIAARYAGFGEPPVALLDNRIGFYLAPNRSYTRFGHDIRVNRYGMRSDDVDEATLDRRFVFSVLGDSVVYGNLLDQADTLPAQLQKVLNGRGRDQKSLVNSIAASSWGPENLLAFYERFGPFPGNTAWIVQNTGDMEDVVDPAGDAPYRISLPRGALHDLALSALRGATLRVLPPKAGPGHEERRRRADAALHALITVLKADYARVVLVFHAARYEAINGRSSGLIHFEMVAKDHHIDFVSTMNLYARIYKSSVTPHYDDVHLSKDGARLLAKLLAGDIEP